jgi:hypothetical protein
MGSPKLMVANYSFFYRSHGGTVSSLKARAIALQFAAMLSLPRVAIRRDPRSIGSFFGSRQPTVTDTGAGARIENVETNTCSDSNFTLVESIVL